MTSEPNHPHEETKSPPNDDSAPQPPRGESPPEPPRAAEESGEMLRLQTRLAPRADGLYYVSELLGYHDEAFVEAAFAAVLRRRPAEEELRRTLSDLRNGAREKLDILRDLARTAEGRSQLAFERIAGLKQSRLAEALRGLPVAGQLWRVLAAVVRLPTALRHQRQFEAYALAQQQHIADYFNAQKRRFEEQLDVERRRFEEQLDEERRRNEAVAAELRQAVADASAALSLLSDALAEIAARQTEQQTAHARRLDAQQEFLVREQQSIVEAQKAALTDAEEGLRETTAAQRRELDALAARVEELRAAVEAARESVGGKL